MHENQNTNKVYDLEERTYIFARDVRIFCKTLPHSITITEDSRQLIRASGSVGANYIEANEALGKKDFLMHIRISRKESKESKFWIRLIKDTGNAENIIEADRLINEANELLKIFSAIIEKSK